MQPASGKVPEALYQKRQQESTLTEQKLQEEQHGKTHSPRDHPPDSRYDAPSQPRKPSLHLQARLVPPEESGKGWFRQVKHINKDATAEELRRECIRLLRLIDDIDDLREILAYLREIVKGDKKD